MKQSEAIQRLNAWDLKAHYIFQHRDLKKIFHEDTERNLNETLKRLVKNQILERVARGIYLYALSKDRFSANTLEIIAKTLR